MKPYGLALLALAALGCGGNSGTQIASLDRSLTLATGSAYAPTTPVGTAGGQPVAPLATFTTDKSQQVVLWGSRDAETGRVSGVREMAYTAPDVRPLYARYDGAGGLVSVLDADTGSYVTFSALDGASLVATGYDATSGKTGSIRATMSDIGVTVEVLDDGSRSPKKRLVRFGEIAASTRIGRDVEGGPLAGLEGAYSDSDERTKIIGAIFRAAALVVDHPFDKILSDVAGFLMLDQLEKSYGEFAAKGLAPTTATDAATPLPYRDDLP